MLLDRFSGGDNLESWIFRAERYFTYLGFSEKDWLPLPYFYLEGNALSWFDSLFRNKQFHDWKHFKEKLFLHFRNHNFSALMGRLEKPSHACSTELGYATVVPLEAQVSSFLDFHIPNSYGCHSALEDETSNADHMFVERLVTVVSPESHDPNTCLIDGKLSATSIDEVFEENLGDKENLVKSNYDVKDYYTEIENHIFDEISHQSTKSKVFIIGGSNSKVLTNTSGSDLTVGTSEEDEVLNESSHSISFGEIRPSATRVSLLVPFTGRESAVSNKHLEHDMPARYVDANSLDTGGTPKWQTDLLTFEDVYLAGFFMEPAIIADRYFSQKNLMNESSSSTSAMHLVEVLFEAENGKSIGRFTDEHILSQFSFDPGANIFIITISLTATHFCVWDRGVSSGSMALTGSTENTEVYKLFEEARKRRRYLFANLYAWEHAGGVPRGVECHCNFRNTHVSYKLLSESIALSFMCSFDGAPTHSEEQYIIDQFRHLQSGKALELNMLYPDMASKLVIYGTTYNNVMFGKCYEPQMFSKGALFKNSITNLLVGVTNALTLERILQEAQVKCDPLNAKIVACCLVIYGGSVPKVINVIVATISCHVDIDHILFLYSPGHHSIETNGRVHATNTSLDANLEDKVLFEDGSIVVNQPYWVRDYGPEMRNEADPVGTIGPRAKGPMIEQPNRILVRYVSDPRGDMGHAYR
ncbi:hypothetical protein A4A49_39873 [Nicotiana attenuata]|uniref:Retrotransposon gag domain-containing protein n=1 Tax=Nicotiana attenuata TaxID=49451 RepID=A0A1J6JUU6_NICAT|nr:hypothetical protein A4A49_39873 [Nicotiana attenuata]